MAAGSRKQVLFGARLSALREGAGLSQGLLAAMAGISQPALSNYEADKREVPLDVAQDLAAALDISLGDLLSGIDEVIVVRDEALLSAVRELLLRPPR